MRTVLSRYTGFLAAFDVLFVEMTLQRAYLRRSIINVVSGFVESVELCYDEVALCQLFCL